MAAQDTSRISPTAHYTGYVWCRNGLSHPALETRAGRVLFHAVNPAMMVARAFGATDIEDMLLARHHCIDDFIERAIARGEVGQVIEIAAGLSPRGYRMMRRYGGGTLTYVEADLPGMCARKRARIASIGAWQVGHHVVELDALLDSGEQSLSGVGERYLRLDVGTAIITEGLVNYFSRAMVDGLWQRIARFLARYPSGLYASDLHVQRDIARIPGANAFLVALSAFTRGNVHIHFSDAQAATDALIAAGFGTAETRSPGDWATDTITDTGQASEASHTSDLCLSPAQAQAPVHLIRATMTSR